MEKCGAGPRDPFSSDIWQSESSDFTPWLAQEENLARLGEEIGIELELEATEQNVGLTTGKGAAVFRPRPWTYTAASRPYAEKRHHFG